MSVKQQEKLFSLDDIATFLRLPGITSHYQAEESLQYIAMDLIERGEFTKAEIRPVFKQYGYTMPWRAICKNCQIDNDEPSHCCKNCSRLIHTKGPCMYDGVFCSKACLQSTKDK